MFLSPTCSCFFLGGGHSGVVLSGNKGVFFVKILTLQLILSLSSYPRYYISFVIFKILDLLLTYELNYKEKTNTS